MIDKLDDKVDRILEITHKQDLLLERLATTSEQHTELLGVQSRSLIEHMARTEANEKRIALMENFFKGVCWVSGVLVTAYGLLKKFPLN